ncbi:MAG: acyltransferase [Deltaproteobacteria bacterium]|nr:acyltransferase [Candidatus Anaeroferrophillacea bacterium]
MEPDNLHRLLAAIHELRDAIRTMSKEKYDRVLPFADMMFDRWEKSRFLGFGVQTSIYDSSLVLGDVNVGEHTWIGPFSLLDGTGKLTIGSYCSISAGVQIYTHDSVAWAVSGGVKSYSYAPVSIGDNCYIGPQSVIVKGVTIGSGSVVGALSYVDRDVPPGVKVWGRPARPQVNPERD